MSESPRRKTRSLWTGPPAIIAVLAADLGSGQILDARDALGGVGPVFSGSWRGGLLVEVYQVIRTSLSICALNQPGNPAIDSLNSPFVQSRHVRARLVAGNDSSDRILAVAQDHFTSASDKLERLVDARCEFSDVHRDHHDLVSFP
jgi:hypothetical protein